MSAGMLNRLAGRLRLVVGRAVLMTVNDAAKLQAVQIRLQAGVERDQAEHFQQYGLTAVAHPGAEGIVLSVGASSGHSVVINVDDRRYRLTGLQAGEVALYDDIGHKVYLTRTGIVVDGGGHQVVMTNLSKLRVEADADFVGQVRDLCDSPSGRTMSQMRTVFNGHTHPENNVPGGNTSVTASTM